MTGKKKKPRFESEAELASEVAKWLEADGWKLWFEVSEEFGGSRADIVACSGPLTMIVETKRTLSFELLAQCDRWVRKGAANYVMCAVPRLSDLDHRRQSARMLATSWSNEHGISVLEMPKIEGTDYSAQILRESVRTKWAPMARPKSDYSIRKSLKHEMRRTRPGTNDGGYVTDFSRTCDKVRKLVKKRGGKAPVREIVDSIKHHYANPQTARARLRKLTEEGVVYGLAIEREGRTPFFVAVDNPEPRVKKML